MVNQSQIYRMIQPMDKEWKNFRRVETDNNEISK